MTERTLACLDCALTDHVLRHLVYNQQMDLVECPVHGVVITGEQLYRMTYQYQGVNQ